MSAEAVKRGRALRNLILVCVGAALTAAALHPLVRAELPIHRVARQTLAARSACQVLFVGPSTVRNQVHPEIVDDEFRRAGTPLRSCKFGVYGLRGYELRLWLERILAPGWPALQWVVIDATLGERPAIAEHNRYQRRVLEWHDAASLPAIVDFYARQPGSLTAHLPELGLHLRHALANRFHMGMGSARLADLDLLGGPRAGQQEPGRRRAGRQEPAGGREGTAAPDERGTFGVGSGAEQPVSHEERIAALVDGKRESRDLRRTVSSAYFDDLRGIVRSQGAEARFVLAPVLFPIDPPAGVLRDADPLILLDFNDPERFPELFRSDRRQKGLYHLNPAGSERYSRLLARELLRRP